MKARLYLADIITSLRIIVIPFLIFSEINSRYVLSFLLICFAALSDMVDGVIARRQLIKSKHGATFDIIADFLIIVICYLLIVYDKEYYLLIIPLMLFCFISFIVSSIIVGRLKKNPVGQFTGTICFSGIIIIFTLRIFTAHLLPLFRPWIIIIVSAYLILATIENLILILRYFVKQNLARK